MDFVDLVYMTDSIELRKGLKQEKESGGEKKRGWKSACAERISFC